MRVTKASVELLFERAVPLLGRQCRTKYSRRGEAPYWELQPSPDGTHVTVVNRKDENTEVGLTTPLTLRDMHHFLDGIVFSDRHIERIPETEATDGA